MNTLSWLIYAADAAGSANALFGLLTFASAPACVASAIIWSGGERTDWDNRKRYPALYGQPEGERPDIIRPFRHLTRPLLALTIASGLIAIAVPRQETVYAIAASEMGERLVQTETAGKALKALNAWLDKQIAPEAKAAN